jgi:CBS domain-containing protein
MKREVKTIRSDMPLSELERKLIGENVSGFPVVDDGVLRGVISRSDILRQLCTERSEAEVAAGFYEDGAGIDVPLPAADWISETIGREIDDLRVSDVMVKKLITVQPTASLQEVAKKMVQHHIHRILVTEDQQLRGIITNTDFARLFADGRIVER